jgi:hypothetical protein
MRAKRHASLLAGRLSDLDADGTKILENRGLLHVAATEDAQDSPWRLVDDGPPELQP